MIDLYRKKAFSTRAGHRTGDHGARRDRAILHQRPTPARAPDPVPRAADLLNRPKGPHSWSLTPRVQGISLHYS